MLYRLLFFYACTITRVCAKTSFIIYIFGYRSEKKFIYTILSHSVLVFAQSDDRGYAHLAIPMLGMFHLREHLLSWNDKGNTVQPTLPCWVVPTAGSLSIMG